MVHIAEDMAFGAPMESEMEHVAKALKTFPGAVLKHLVLHGPIPRYWTKIEGTALPHAEDVTTLDFAEVSLVYVCARCVCVEMRPCVCMHLLAEPVRGEIRAITYMMFCKRIFCV